MHIFRTPFPEKTSGGLLLFGIPTIQQKVWVNGILMLFDCFSWKIRRYSVRTIPANTSTLNQCSWDLFQRWYLVENESWGDKHFSKLFQRWQNNVETTSIKLYQFNVDDPTLFQHWYLVEDESWANVCLSTLGIFTKQWVNNKIPACIYMFKVNNRNTRTRCEICSKVTIKTPEQRQLASFWCLYC